MLHLNMLSRMNTDMAALEQPNFIEHTNLGNTRNTPALDAGGQILAELRVIVQRLDRIESRFDAA